MAASRRASWSCRASRSRRASHRAFRAPCHASHHASHRSTRCRYAISSCLPLLLSCLPSCLSLRGCAPSWCPATISKPSKLDGEGSLLHQVLVSDNDDGGMLSPLGC
jgi:hypothetical protein